MALLSTVADLHQSFSDLLNETAPPATTDPLYSARTRWFNRGQEDIARRWFFRSLLRQTTISLVAGTASYLRPADLEKPNGLLVFHTAATGILYTDPYESSGSVPGSIQSQSGWRVSSRHAP